MPNNAPIPAVTAIASIPQKVTRAAPRNIEAPPAWAASDPRIPRKIRVEENTTNISILLGTMKIIASGIAAPTEKDPADANAACTGRAVLYQKYPILRAHGCLSHLLASIAQKLFSPIKNQLLG